MKYFQHTVLIRLLLISCNLICVATRIQALPISEQMKSPNEIVYVISNVNVISMNSDSEILSTVNVIIKGGEITSLNGIIPENAEVIDGKDKWLMPGLFDMHVHVPTDGHFNATYPTRIATIFTSTQDVMTPFVVNGVTTILDLNSRAGHFGQRNEILRGDVVGPRMALAAMIDGGEGSGRTADSPSDGRQVVRTVKAEGYEFIKTYSKLNIETYKAVIDEADKQGMKVVGHIPNQFKGKIGEAFLPHFGMIAHAEELFKQVEGLDEQNPKYLAQLAKENGTWLCPTLIVIVSATDQGRSLDGLRESPWLQYVHPLLQSKWLTSNNYNKNATHESLVRLEKMIEFNSRLVKAFNEAGVPIVAGTDAGSSGVIWGISLHDELELLVKAGLTPEEALRSATRLPAIWLGLERITGTIEVGKSADLVLLDENPLIDIRNTRKISGVFVNGRWLDKAKIDTMLIDLSKRNTASKDRYEWSKRGEY